MSTDQFIEVDPRRVPLAARNPFGRALEHAPPAPTKDEEDRDKAARALIERLNDAGFKPRRSGVEVEVDVKRLTVVRGSDRNRSCGFNIEAIGIIPEGTLHFQEVDDHVFLFGPCGWSGRALVRDGDRTYRVSSGDDGFLKVPLSVSRVELIGPPNWVSNAVRLASENKG